MASDFYWIDNYQEYDESLAQSVKNQFSKFYEPLANQCGYNFAFVDAAETICSVGTGKTSIQWKGKELLKPGNCGYIGTYNPNPSIEQRLKTLHGIAAESKEFRLINRTRSYINPDNDKFFALTVADTLGVGAIPSLFIPHSKILYSSLVTIADALGGFPLIAKPKDMLAGMGVVRVGDSVQLKSICECTSFGTKGFMLQKFIDIHADVRVFYSEGKILCALWRTPARKEGLGNVSQGALAETRVSLPESLTDSAKKIGDYLKASYLCIDYLFDGKTFFFSEIETGGGFASLDESHRLEVARAFFGAMK